MGKEIKILGVCNANVSGATLLVGNDVSASVNEERFSRLKNDRAFPRKSIEYCLESSGLKPDDIDYVACGAWKGVDESFLPQYIDDVIDAVIRDPSAKQLVSDKTRVSIERDHYAKNDLIINLEKMGFSPDKISFYDHHLSHAYTAFYPSPFKEALVLTIDGRGDFKSATMNKASRSSGIELLDSVSMLYSLGAFYGFITRFLGFTPDKHEGKVTGLAAYGNPDKCMHILKRMINYSDKIIAYLGRDYSPFLSARLPELEKELSQFSREDISAAAQQLTEEITLNYLKEYLQLTKLKNVCLSGGVFGNVKLNEKILELDEVENIYVFPQMGDGGNPFGGALIKLYELGKEFNYPLKHVYLGPEYSSEEITKAVDGFKGKVKCVPLKDYTLRKVAQDIADGKCIGIFSGRMEFGPRALGARSILVRGGDRDITNILNKKLNRSEFMPFAPVTLEEYADDYYEDWNKEHISSYFMTVCYKCKTKATELSRGVVHVDNTARPQIINGDYNKLYYDLLTEYHKLTGIPTFINTSFNNHEEPIVCSPEDAIKSLLIDNVDYILMKDLIVSKA